MPPAELHGLLFQLGKVGGVVLLCLNSRLRPEPSGYTLERRWREGEGGIPHNDCESESRRARREKPAITSETLCTSSCDMGSSTTLSAPCACWHCHMFPSLLSCSPTRLSSMVPKVFPERLPFSKKHTTDKHPRAFVKPDTADEGGSTLTVLQSSNLFATLLPLAVQLLSAKTRAFNFDRTPSSSLSMPG